MRMTVAFWTSLIAGEHISALCLRFYLKSDHADCLLIGIDKCQLSEAIQSVNFATTFLN